jgi:hypothetical protein
VVGNNSITNQPLHPRFRLDLARIEVNEDALDMRFVPRACASRFGACSTGWSDSVALCRLSAGAVS